MAYLCKLPAIASCWLLLASLCFGAGKHDSNLNSLYDAHRWFDLRHAVATKPAPPFYRGAVECAFNDVRRCEKDLRSFLKTDSRSDLALEAHRILINAYYRRGQNKKALEQVDAALKLKPDASDVLGRRPLISVLSDFPDQAATLHPSSLKLADGGLPFSINGVQGTYWFDTGAELSVMTESEAKRFGLSPREVETKIGDVNGTLFKTRVAVAGELTLGSVRLKNVAFLVFSDDQPPFNQLSAGSKGLIGIPVLLALERFSWSMDNIFEIGVPGENKDSPHAELCFDGQHPVTQLRYEGRSLMFPVDTGATSTDLYPPFAAAFPELIRSATKTKEYKMEGNGGAKYMEAATLSSLHFSIGGFPVVLKSTGVLLNSTTGTSKLFAGNLGIDLLQQAHKTTFDFKAMTLTLK